MVHQVTSGVKSLLRSVTAHYRRGEESGSGRFSIMSKARARTHIFRVSQTAFLPAASKSRGFGEGEG